MSYTVGKLLSPVFQCSEVRKRVTAYLLPASLIMKDKYFFALCLKYLNCENVTSDITFRSFMNFQKYFEQQLTYGSIFMFYEFSIAIILILAAPKFRRLSFNLYCTCLCIYTTDPNSLHVPPCRSTCNIRRICRKRTPLKI